VGTKQIRAGGVRNSDVAVGSLRFDRLKRESVPGGTAIVRSALLASGAPIIYGTVMCKTDEVATGGGFSNPGSFDGPNGYEIVTDAPNFNKTTNLATGWSVVARRGTASVSDTPSVYVVCYSASRE
jgi:hypothetical protein